MTQPYVRLACRAVVTLAGLAAGCGAPPTGTVSGTVTVGGQPVANGLISFSSEVGKRDVYSAAVRDGKYATGPIPVGPARVTVITRGANPAAAGNEGGSDVAPVARKAAKKEATVAPRYAATDTSGLAHDIAPGENVKNFDLAP